ncbi:hypothetical protein JCM8547_003226 [Rhodosporidiobolus lusitaniae]
MSFLPHLPSNNCILDFPSLPELGCWISSNGRALPILGVDLQSDSDTSIGYVEAVPGERFKVHCVDLRTTRPEEEYELALKVDGQDVNGTVTSRNDRIFAEPLAASSRILEHEGKETTETTQRLFRFSNLRLTDNENAASTAKRFINRVGTIVLRYVRVGNCEHVSMRPPGGQEMGVLNEEEKRIGVTLQTEFEPPIHRVSVSSAHFSDFTRIDPKERPFAQVEFRYRTKAVLQQQDLLAADPPSYLPVPIMVEGDALPPPKPEAGTPPRAAVPLTPASSFPPPSLPLPHLPPVKAESPSSSPSKRLSPPCPAAAAEQAQQQQQKKKRGKKAKLAADLAGKLREIELLERMGKIQAELEEEERSWW